MKSLIFILFIPIAVFSQKPNDNWLTPFATVEFEGEMIVYKYCNQSPNCALELQYAIPDRIIQIPDAFPMIGCKEINEGIKVLQQYLANPQNPKDEKSDRLRYLKAFALQTILALKGDGLPPKELFSIVEHMVINPDKEPSSQAALVSDTYRLVENALLKKQGYIKYFQLPDSTTLIPEMFSTDRIISVKNLKEDEKLPDSTVWPKLYGEPDRMDFSYEVCETYDRGFFILGGYDNSNFVAKYTWLIKTDVNGNVLWDKILKCDGFVKSFAMEPTHDGGLLICGGILLNEFGLLYFPFIIKFNACGQKDWCKVFTGGTGEIPWAQDVKETPSGDILLLVNQYGENPEETMHLFKLNQFGELLWKKPIVSGYNYPEGALPLGNKLLITTENKFLVTGDIYWADPWNPGGAKGLRSLYVMVDSTGEEEWVLPFGLQDTIIGKALMTYQLDDSVFAGVATNWTDEVNPMFTQFNKYGDELAHNTVDMSMINPDIGEGIFSRIRKIDTVFYTGGGFYISNPVHHDQLEAAISSNFLEPNFNVYNYLIHYNKDSPYDLAVTNGNKLLSNAMDISNSPDYDIYLAKLNTQLEFDTAYPGTYTYDSLCTIPGLPQSGFIFLDDCDIITGVDIPSPEEYYASLQVIPITAFPNPTKDKVTFGLENTEHHKNITLKCFNLLGKRVFETTVITGQKEAATNVSHWPQGMYVVVVYSEGLPAGECKFVVE